MKCIKKQRCKTGESETLKPKYKWTLRETRIYEHAYMLYTCIYFVNTLFTVYYSYNSLTNCNEVNMWLNIFEFKLRRPFPKYQKYMTTLLKVSSWWREGIRWGIFGCYFCQDYLGCRRHLFFAEYIHALICAIFSNCPSLIHIGIYVIDSNTIID